MALIALVFHTTPLGTENSGSKQPYYLIPLNLDDLILEMGLLCELFFINLYRRAQFSLILFVLFVVIELYPALISLA